MAQGITQISSSSLLLLLLSISSLLSFTDAAMPVWSWDTIQTFVHCSNSSGPLNNEAIQAMASAKFAVIEKYQGLNSAPVDTGAELKVIEAARAVRSVNPNATMIFYFAVDYARKWYDLGTWFDAHPSYEVHNADGSLATVQSEGFTWHVFDFAVPEAQQAWVNAIADVVFSSDLNGNQLFDGVFIDGYRSYAGWAQQLIPKANASEQANWLQGAYSLGPQLRDALIDTKSIRIINPGEEMSSFPGYNAISIEFFAPQPSSISELQALAATQSFVEVHAYIGANIPLFNLTLAAYLIAVGENAYFGSGSQWSMCDDWLFPVHDEYTKTLGPPDGAASVTNGTFFTRTFGGGKVKVMLDTSKQTSCIWWSDGSITGNATSCASPSPLPAASATASVPTATITVDIATPLTIPHPLNANYLSFNIDTGSLYNLFDVTNPTLINLLKQLGNAQNSSSTTTTSIRFGGGAADSTLFMGANGPSGAGQSPWSNTILVNASYWDQIVAFARAAGTKLVWDLNGCLRSSDNTSWLPTANATALFDHIVANNQEDAILAWQLGNEPTLWKKRGIIVSGAQLGEDYKTLRTLLATKYPTLPQVIYGPDGCCGDSSFLEEFLPVVSSASALDYLSEHFYPITPNGPACTVTDYLTKSYYESTLSLLSTYQGLLNKYAPSIPLVLGETATTNMGGCAGLSDRFLAGFYFIYILGGASANGVVQINRQDLAGYSSQTEPSQYMLAGQPGWTNGTLSPHPDFYTAVLWQQIRANGAPLNITWSMDVSSYADSFSVHAGCASSLVSSSSSGAKGAVVVSYINTGASSVVLQVGQNGLQSLVPRTEYFLTSEPAVVGEVRKSDERKSDESERKKTAATTTTSAPPSSLTGDSIFLNSVELTVDPATGLLPTFPVEGHVVTSSSTPLSVPAYSYGFVVFPSANSAACM